VRRRVDDIEAAADDGHRRRGAGGQRAAVGSAVDAQGQA
jgi:hypothetical protein